MSSLPVSDLTSISRFVRTLRDSAATHQAYKATLRGFLRFVRAQSGDGPLSTPLLRLWLKDRARQSPLRTVHAYACHVDRFLQWRQDCMSHCLIKNVTRWSGCLTWNVTH
jgi:hypothetical protein